MAWTTRGKSEVITYCSFNPDGCPHIQAEESPEFQVGGEKPFRGTVYSCHWHDGDSNFPGHDGVHVIDICGKKQVEVQEVSA